MAGQGEGYGEVMNISVLLLGGWGGRVCVCVWEGGGGGRGGGRKGQCFLVYNLKSG